MSLPPHRSSISLSAPPCLVPWIPLALSTTSRWCFQDYLITLFLSTLLFPLSFLMCSLNIIYHPHSKLPKCVFPFQTFARFLKVQMKLFTMHCLTVPHIPRPYYIHNYDSLTFNPFAHCQSPSNSSSFYGASINGNS